MASEAAPAAAAIGARPLRKRVFGALYRLAYHLRAFLGTEVRHDLARLSAAQADLAAALTQLAARHADGQARLEGELGAMGADLARLVTRLEAQGRDLAQVRATTDTVLGILGPRFDELEIKVRPVLAYDADSYAIRLADGYVMAPRSEPAFAVMIANAPSGGLEAGTRRVLQALIQPGMQVADVGANIGLLTLACARATGPQGCVHAFEPEPGPRAQLEKTCALNGLSQVVVHAAAAGRRRERRTFFISPVIGHSSLYALPAAEAPGARAVKVPVVTLDAAARDVLLDVVKIDVEGAELDVLAGMGRHTAADRDIALVVEFGPSHLERLKVDPKAWWAAFTDLGFRAYAIAEPSGVCAPIQLAAARRAESLNLAWVRPGGAAHRRLPRG